MVASSRQGQALRAIRRCYARENFAQTASGWAARLTGFILRRSPPPRLAGALGRHRFEPLRQLSKAAIAWAVTPVDGLRPVGGLLGLWVVGCLAVFGVSGRLSAAAAAGLSFARAERSKSRRRALGKWSSSIARLIARRYCRVRRR
jgi:hypothetical protein